MFTPCWRATRWPRTIWRLPTCTTALGQDIYTQQLCAQRPLSTISTPSTACAITAASANFIQNEHIHDGIIYSCEKCGVPYVLGGSIRDDGPLPPVYGDVYAAQNAMRDQIRSATTVISMATMLHTIATGNMTPSLPRAAGRHGAAGVFLLRRTCRNSW